MTQATAQTLIWISAVAAIAITVVAMAARRMFAEFPRFGYFVAFELFANLVTHWCWVHMDSKYYFFVYWPDALIEATFTLFVLQELFREVLRPYANFRSLAPSLYWAGALIVLPVSLWMGYMTPRPNLAEWTNGLVSVERSFSFVQLSLVVLLFVFCRIFALHWRPYTLGIALGFGLWASIEVLASSLRVQLGMGAMNIYILAAPLAFTVGSWIWAFYVVRSEAAVPVPETLLSPQLARWDMALEELQVR